MPATTKKQTMNNLYFDRYLSHLNHITWAFVFNRGHVLCPFVMMFFVYPPALHAHFTSCKNTWKRSLLAICRSWDASAENRLASKVAQLRQIASELRFHVLLQEVKCAWSARGCTKNAFTKGHKPRPRLNKNVPRDVVQMRQIAIKVKVLHCLTFRGCRHRAKSPPTARSNTLLFVAFDSLFEHMKLYDWEGKKHRHYSKCVI